MSFNPDITKQAVEVIFSNKKSNAVLNSLTFNNIPVKNVDETKHLGMILDKRLSFENHIVEKIAKANQGIGIMKQLYRFVPRNTLEVVYKLYVRPHLDYGDVMFHIPDKDNIKFDSLDDHIHPLIVCIESVQIAEIWEGSAYSTN